MDVFVVLPHKGGSLGQAALPACPRGCRVAVTSVLPLSPSWLGGHVPWSLPRLQGCVWPSLENRFPARGREEGTDEGLVEVKRQTACRPGEIRGDIPWGMNLGGQQDLCPDLCAFWGTRLPWRWLARAWRCSPSFSLLVAFSIGFVPTDAACGGSPWGGRRWSPCPIPPPPPPGASSTQVQQQQPQGSRG